MLGENLAPERETGHTLEKLGSWIGGSMADVEKRAREQYAELVDKKFCSVLSES